MNKPETTWIQNEFSNEKQFDPAQLNYVLLHSNALIQFIKEQYSKKIYDYDKSASKPLWLSKEAEDITWLNQRTSVKMQFPYNF